MNDTPENPPKVPFLSSHPFVASEDIRVSYSTDCPACKKQTQWSADAFGSWCNECCLFVDRDTITDAPIITSDNPPQDVTAQPVESGTEDSADLTDAVNALRYALGGNPLVLVDRPRHKGGVFRHFLSDPELEDAIKAVIPHLPVNVPNAPDRSAESTQTFTQHAGGCDWGGPNPTPENPPQDIIDRPVEKDVSLPLPDCSVCGGKTEWSYGNFIQCPACGWCTSQVTQHVVGGASQPGQVGVVAGSATDGTTIQRIIETAEEVSGSAPKALLEDAELEKIVLSALSARKHTEEELVALADWACDTKLRSAALNLVLNDLVTIEWKVNQPVFRKKP